jgi:hypothetical protein
VPLDFQKSKSTALDERFLSKLFVERVVGIAVEAKRGSPSILLMVDPGKSLIPRRTLMEIFILRSKPGNSAERYGVFTPEIIRDWSYTVNLLALPSLVRIQFCPFSLYQRENEG